MPPKVEMVVSTREEAPVRIEIASKPNITNETAANEVVANLKMIGLAICVIAAYFVGFSVYHAKDKKPLNENGYFGESCYDGVIYGGNWEFSWEKIYYKKVDAIKPYSQWSSLNKKLGIPDMDYDSYVFDVGIDIALEMANKIARSKGIPKDVMEMLQSEAKEQAKNDRQSFNEEVSSKRKYSFERALKKNTKWCAIISFVFFILGRYIIKFGKWVANNKSE